MPFDHAALALANHDSAQWLRQPPRTGLAFPPLVINMPTSQSSAAAYSVAVLTKSVEDTDRALFDQAVNEWVVETQWFSSMASITRHPQFDAIKHMGQKAIKFILARMAKGEIRVHWFPLLKDLSGTDPVPPDKRGIIGEMAAEWIKWGESHGYLNA